MRVAIASAALLGFAVAAPAASAHSVAIDQRAHYTTDTVTATAFPSHSAPPGWHYELAMSLRNQDENGEGCDFFRVKVAGSSRRAFSVRFRPRGGVWCTGSARVIFYIARNGDSNRVKYRAQSLQLRFANY